jgi:O6-methylguanine-DNA--protein-cysteine methyltransferase
MPFAKSRSYKDIAVLIANKKVIRAVGSANGKNKLSIVNSFSSNYRVKGELNRLCRWFVEK